MYLHKKLSTAVTLLECAAVLLISVFILIFSESCKNGIIKGIDFSLRVLVPSLFPFMALSSFTVSSGLAQKLGKPLEPVMRLVFGLDGCFAPLLLLSLIGGYPVGARGAAASYRQGGVSREQAERFSYFAVCAGPGFIVNYLGAAVFNSMQTGLIILSSQVISVIFLGWLLKITSGRKIVQDNAQSKELPGDSLSTAFVVAAADSSRGILNICTFVVLFSAFTQVITELSDSALLSGVLVCLLEVCTAVNSLSDSYGIEAVAFAVGFGGLCVHFQIYSALKGLRINKLKFFCIRIIQGLLTFLLTYTGLNLFSGVQSVFSTSAPGKAGLYSGSIISGAVLIIAAICFLFSLKNIEQKS